jgi:alpha-ribazole phosphatase
LKARLVSAWEAYLARYPGERLLLVTHGGPIRVLLCHVSGTALDGLLDLEVRPAARYRLRVPIDALGGVGAILP